MQNTTTSTGLSLRQLLEREDRVFPTYPQVARYFPAASIEDARHRLGRAIERGDGPGLVIGGPGTGKSLLLQVLASQFHERFDVVLPACARLCTRRALLQAILFELGLPYRLRDEGELRLSLLDHLLSREECPTGLLLLVDEAQTLSINLLDELRVLTNLVRGGMPRVRLVLAGSSALEESFAHPELESFSQRLSARCYLAPFGHEETAQFVRAQIAASSGSPDDLFAHDAWGAIFEATDGVPRLVNQLCDRALAIASTTNRSRIDRSVIQNAWADIQQLPAPWDTPAPTTAPPAPLQVVEFGQLEETLDADRELIEEPAVAEPAEDEHLDLELTELDPDDEEVVVSNGYQAPPTDKASDRTSDDPFSEAFDEEEVVLDGFANWDDMIRREAPRVQNRSNPEFATLVQAAIPEVYTNETLACAATSATPRVLDADLDDGDAATTDYTESDSTPREAINWPPLRLAIVSDSLPTEVPSETPAELAEIESFISAPDRNGLQPTPWAHDARANEDIGANASVVNLDEPPVLILEDDDPAPNPPVRREEYRNLFSRLRSG
jgi:type II secretory pathway predicted ATPase ExeA